jgi:hypothetical protein
MYPEYNKK